MQVDENKPIVEVSDKMDVIEKERESAGNKKENGDDAGLKKESGDGGVQIIGNEDNSLQGKIIRFVEVFDSHLSPITVPLFNFKTFLLKLSFFSATTTCPEIVSSKSKFLLMMAGLLLTP